MNALPYIEIPMPPRTKATGINLAHAAINYAKRRGILKTSYLCAVCEKTAKGNRLKFHHDDYAFPCRVTALCARCHAKRHAQLKHDGAYQASRSAAEAPGQRMKQIRLEMDASTYATLTERGATNFRGPIAQLMFEARQYHEMLCKTPA